MASFTLYPKNVPTQHQSEAVVLRTWPVHEADQIVSLLTREQGKLRGVAKSASRSRRRFGGALEPMTHVLAHYAVRPRQELVRLDSLEILHSPLSTPKDYPRAAALAFYTEVLDEMLPDGMSADVTQDAAFRLVVQVAAATEAGRVWAPVTYFALWMVRLMGWMPSLNRCTLCRRAFEPEEPASWNPFADGLLCQANPAHKRGEFSLAADSRALAGRLFRAPIAEAAEQPWPRARAQDLRRFLMHALERHGEQRLQSVTALIKLGG